jgi:hypothetical protein
MVVVTSQGRINSLASVIAQCSRFLVEKQVVANLTNKEILQSHS